MNPEQKQRLLKILRSPPSEVVIPEELELVEEENPCETLEFLLEQ